VRGIALKKTHQMICRENKARIDRLLEPKVPSEEVPQKRVRKGKATCFRNADRQPVSTIGTEVIKAFKAETGVDLSCGQCKNWAFGLNRKASHDHDDIVQYMFREFPWPHAWRQQHTNRRDRISEIVSPIVPRVVKPEIPVEYFAGRLTAITSINPNPSRWERQQKCLESWVRHGLPVVIVNTQAEIDRFTLPAGARAVPREDMTTLYDRRTQYVTSLIEVGIETGNPFMLINSDIEMKGDVKLLDEALAFPDKLTIGIRYNHHASTPTSKAIRELSGLDVFLMTPEMARTVPDAPFGIGKPVWDYWMPTHFRSIGKEFHWIKAPLFFHEKHKLGWTQSEWKCGRDFLDKTYGVELGYGCSRFRQSLDESMVTAHREDG
jgi:hypothetical protein